MLTYFGKASAQNNGLYDADRPYDPYRVPAPCAPPSGSTSSIQRARECEQVRDAIIQQQQRYLAQQGQQAAQREAAEAQARAAAEAQLVAQRTAAQRQASAENSPNNLCKTPDIARHIMKDYNALHWPAYDTREVVDIEHLITVANDPGKGIISCHGVWVHTNGQNIEGTLTIRPNVAGDLIANWKQEHLEPPFSTSQQVSVKSTASVPMGSETDSTDQPAAYSQGFADRKEWEDWFAGTSGDYRAGALFWAGQRSLPHPTPCTTLDGDAAAGCNAAQARLTTPDARRKREISYKQGWNAYTPP